MSMRFFFFKAAFVYTLASIAMEKNTNVHKTWLWPGNLQLKKSETFTLNESKTASLRHKRAERTSQETAREAQEKLNSLFSKLNSYVSHYLFAYEKFGLDSQGLQEEIQDVSTLLYDLGAPDPEMLAELNFSKSVYWDMIDALALYRQFPPGNNENNSILRNIAQLNASVFNLRKQNGIPNESLANYESMVVSLAHALAEWLVELGSSAPVSDLLRVAIEPPLRKFRMKFQELAHNFE